MKLQQQALLQQQSQILKNKAEIMEETNDRYYLVPPVTVGIKHTKHKRKSKEEILRDEIRNDLQEVWLKYANNKYTHATFLESIVDYIIEKDSK